MRRYVILTVALLATLAWSGSGFAREGDKDSSNDNSSNANQANANDSSDNAQSTRQNANSQRGQDNQRQNNSDDEHHAALGISMVESDGHVRVTAIMPGSPAARAGVQVGDEIRSVDDQRIRTTDGLTEEISDKQPGATVDLAIRRNGESRTLRARLASSQEFAGNRRNNGRRQQQQYAQQPYGQQTGQYGWNEEYGNRGYRQNGWNRNRASSYDPNSQSVEQQIRQLRQQVAQLQEEVDDLRNQPSSTRVGYRGRSNNTSRDGQSSGNDRNRDSD